MWNMKAPLFIIKTLWPMSVFQIGQMSRLALKERSYHKNIHVKPENSSTHCSKVISNVKVFNNVKLQCQCHRVKNVGTLWKFLSLGIPVWNIKAIALIVLKL